MINADDPILMMQKIEVRKDAIDKQYNELRAAGIKCDIERGQSDVPAVKGMHKGEPFIVYAAFITNKHDPSVWVLEVRTRYKGTEVPGDRPIKVLTK